MGGEPSKVEDPGLGCSSVSSKSVSLSFHSSHCQRKQLANLSPLSVMHIHRLIRRFLNSNANTSKHPCRALTNTPTPTPHLNTTNPLASLLEGNFTHSDGRSCSCSCSTSLSEEHNLSESLLKYTAGHSGEGHWQRGRVMAWTWHGYGYRCGRQR